MPRLFPVNVKRTTVVSGGDGPNPSDSLSIRPTFSDTNEAPTDQILFGFSFPDNIPALVDAAQLILRLADNILTPSDQLALLRLAFAESIPMVVDDVSLRVAYAESSQAPTDNLRLNITGMGDSVAAPSDTLALLRVQFSDTNSAPSDAARFDITARYDDSSSAPTDDLRLTVRGLGDVNTAPTDAQSGRATWIHGATTAASGGAQAWGTPANAQGLADGALASIVDNNALAASSGLLNLDPYPDPPTNLGSWTIQSVRLLLYASGASGTLGLPSRVIRWRLGTGAYVDLETITASFDGLVTPRTYDITSARAWTWADINNLNTQLSFTSALAATGNTFNVDAFVVEVIATKTPI